MSHYYWWIARDSPGFCSTLHLQKSSSEVAALGTDPLILVQEKRMLMLAFNEPATSVVVALFLFLFYLMNWLKKIVRQCVSAFFCIHRVNGNSFVMVYMNAINDKMIYEGLEEVFLFQMQRFLPWCTQKTRKQRALSWQVQGHIIYKETNPVVLSCIFPLTVL